jgi:hypothetical protein
MDGYGKSGVAMYAQNEPIWDVCTERPTPLERQPQEKDLAMRQPTWRRATQGMSRLLLAVTIAALLASSPRAAAAESAEIDRLAFGLIDRFYHDLAPDNAALAGFLGEGFQIIGSDGLRFNRESYLVFPKTITQYEISGLVARRDGNVLTATFELGYLGTFEGIARDVPRLARLAVFQETDVGWKLQALAALGTGQNAIDSEAVGIVSRWQAAITSGDSEQIRALTAPDFQIQQPDGKGNLRTDYLKGDLERSDPAKIENLVVTSFNNTLVTRYNLRVGDSESVEPRLTVFERINGVWLAAAEAQYLKTD